MGHRHYVGGLVGYNIGNVSGCYSTGSVTGATIVSGLVVNCFCEGMDGLPTGGYVWASFWDVQASGQPIGDGGIGKTTAEMQTRSTFIDAGWDFVDIWLINEGATYPVLRQEIRSDLNNDDSVNMLDLALFASHWLEEN